MIARIVNWARTLLMRVKFPMMCNFVGRDDDSSLGMNGEWDQLERKEALELEKFSWLDLPCDIVELILSKQRLEDKGKLAGTCKTWRDIIRTLQAVYPVGKIPLLLHVKSRGEGESIVHYYSLLLNKTFQMRFPVDLRGCDILCARDGFLLIYNRDPDVMEMMLLDPFVERTRFLPVITSNISFNGAAIGYHDNSDLVFLIDTSHENQVTVHLYQGGVWAFDVVYDNGNKSFHMSSNPVYCRGGFYCLGTKGDALGVFNILVRTWYVYSIEVSSNDDDDDDDDDDGILSRCCYYLVDWIDTMMAVQVKNNGNEIHFFLLDREEFAWKETYDLCGRSLFLGSTASAMCLPTAKRLQNRVFLPHSHQDNEPKAVTVADWSIGPDHIYFTSVSSDSISSWEKNHAATTMCSNSGEESVYLGSTQNEEYCTMWYQPCVFED